MKGPIVTAILKIGTVWLELTSRHLDLLQKMLCQKSSAARQPPCHKGGKLWDEGGKFVADLKPTVAIAK